MSYHDRIQSKAREIEQIRSRSYSKTGRLELSEFQLLCTYGAIYKLLRVKLSTRDKFKALDDVIDAYNYCALLFEDLSK